VKETVTYKPFNLIAACLGIVAAAPAVAQPTSPDPGRIIGQAIAAGVTLATDDFAAVGRYDVSDEADSSFRVRQLGGRHRFKTTGRWQPFVGGRLGHVRLNQNLDLGGSSRSALEFDVWGLAIEGGARARFDGGWFGEFWGETSYSFVENRLRYVDSELAVTLGPLLDGVFFNWEAEAMTFEAGLGLGWEHTSESGVRSTISAGLTRLRTDPVDTEHPIQDVTVESGFERLLADFEIPVNIKNLGRPWRLDARLRHTFLDDDLADPLDSHNFTDLRLALLALWPETSRLPIDGLGIAVTYTTADAFDGWSVGLTIGR
jgi:hypothetical protein